MTDRTTNLSMPFILPSQAQKHVTHNEALQALDAVVQLAVEDVASAPPAAPGEGMRFIVAAGASGAWAGHQGQIAAWQDGAWSFFTPKEGWLAWVVAARKLKVFHAAIWNDLHPADAELSRLGINTAADNNNRLAVASETSLFTHVGHGHQAKINKSSAKDTATLLFQSNWTGHAEMGLAGDNEFSIKVSNGKDWLTALQIRQDGTVIQPQRPAGRAYKNNGTTSPAPDSESGFTSLDQVAGKVALGAALGNGDRTLVVPVRGLYLVSLMSTAVSSSGHSTALLRNRSEILFTLWAPGAAPMTVSHSQPLMLEAGDELSLKHAGTAQIYNAAGATQLALVML